MIELFQIIVLVTTAAFWWFARRDLNAQAANRQSASLKEIHEVRETIENLLSVLEDKYHKIDDDLRSRMSEAEEMASRLEQVAKMRAGSGESAPALTPSTADHNIYFDKVVLLAESGIAAKEIAQQLSISVGEVETIMSIKH